MTEIEITDLTNGSLVNNEWQGTGVFDTLIAAVNKNIELQYSKGRITGQDYGTVYLGAMQAVLGQSIEFLLRRDLTEAQIDDARKGIELKEAQKQLAYVERIIKDKEAAALGLDKVLQVTAATPENVYTPKYEE